MPEYQISFIDKHGTEIVTVGGAGWVYTTDEAGFMIQRKKANFYVQVGDHKVEVKAVLRNKFGRHWNLTTESDDAPSNELEELPVRRTI
jgi:5-keto 4-deoxyuronate isomerase